MLSEFGNIIRTARFRHLIAALADPLHSLEAFRYHYRRVNEKEFVSFFAEKFGCGAEAVRSVYKDFHAHVEVWERLRRDLYSTPGSPGPQMIEDGPSLYLLVRLLKPAIVVETGVAAGVSSCFILRAMQDNNMGRLYSIEAAATIKPQDKKTGWLVPDGLRHRWELLIGDSKQLLGPLLDKVGSIDCFMHDSLHTYEHMFWELGAAWGHLSSKSLLLVHDVGENRAFFDFMREKKVPWSAYRVHGLLGGFRGGGRRFLNS